MASITELQAHIRFQLAQLKVQNKHHEFEKLSALLFIVPLSLMVLTLLTISTFQPAYAGDSSVLTAGELSGFCSSKDLAVNNACRFYILGAISGLSLGGNSTMDNSGRFVMRDKKDFCIPDDLPISQSVSIYQNMAQADFAKFPEDRDIPAISLVVAIMSHRFPCQK